jgi:hypothetical protein
MRSMPDAKVAEAVQRLRKSRREAGYRETNVWIPPVVGAALDEAIASGRFKTRQQAIQDALVTVFVRKEDDTTN